MSPWAFAASFAAIVAARHLLEILGGQNPVYFPLQFLVHYPLAYLAPMLGLVLTLHLFSGTPVVRVTRLMLHVWLLTLLPPLIDVARGRGAEGIGYLRLGRHGAGEVFLRFLDPRFTLGGTTAGIRLETALACLLAAAYVWLKRRDGRPARAALMAAGAAAAVYPIALGFFTLPMLAAAALAPVIAGGDAARVFAAPQVISIGAPLDVRVADHVAVAYLVPLCLGLGLLWSWRAAPARLGRRLTTAIGAVPPLFPVIGAAGLAFGALAREHLDQRALVAAPVDWLAAASVVAAVALVGAGSRLDGPPPAGSGVRFGAVVLILAGLSLAAVVGPPTILLIGTLPALAWLRRRPPLRLDGRWPAGPLLAGVETIAILAAGASWGLGTLALAALPPALVRAVLAAGVLSAAGRHLPVGRRSRFVTRPGWPGPVAHGAIAGTFQVAAAVAVAILVGAGWPLVLVCAAGVGAATLPRLAGHAVAWLESVALAGAAALALAGGLGTPAEASALVHAGVDRPKFILRQARALEDAGDLSAAIGRYRAALEQDPAQPRVLTHLGELYREVGNRDASMTALREAAALDPDDVASRQQLGEMLLADGKVAEAVDALESAFRVNPSEPLVALSRAKALTRLPGARRRAIDAWHVYLDVSRDVPGEEVYRRRARDVLAGLMADLGNREPPGTDPAPSPEN
ncbi:MAG: tetratricopeptide repeat protein [Acidobacteriota bacterium]